MLIIQFRMMWAVFTARHPASSCCRQGHCLNLPWFQGKELATCGAWDLENCVLPQELIWVETSDGLGVIPPVGGVIHMETKSILSYQVTVMALWIFCSPISSPLPPNLWISGLVFSFLGCGWLFFLPHSAAVPHLYTYQWICCRIPVPECLLFLRFGWLQIWSLPRKCYLKKTYS